MRTTFSPAAALRNAYDACRRFYARDRVHVWLLLLTFVFTFGYALVYQIPQVSDSRGHHGIAVNLATRGTFCLECDTVPLGEDRAIYWIGPGYQFFLAGSYKLFGIRPWVVWLLQALMHTAVVAMLWRLMRRLAPVGPTVPWWYRAPLALYAFHPDIVQLHGMLMTEPLFLLLLVGSVSVAEYVLSGVAREASLRRHWVATVALGVLIWASFMVRQAGAGLILLVILFAFWKRLWKEAIIMTCVTAALLVPWAVRNYFVYDRLVFNSIAGGLNSWVGYHPDSRGEFEVPPEIEAKIEGLSPAEREALSAAEVRALAVSRPGHMVVRTLQKGFKQFALTKTSGFWFHYFGAWDQVVTLVGSILFNLALLSLGFAALIQLLLKRRVDDWRLVFLGLLAFLLIAPPILTVVINRYRIPILPIFAILSVTWLTSARSNAKRDSLAYALVFLGIATAVDVWGSVPKVIEHLERIRAK